jgi:hypothetical protein
MDLIATSLEKFKIIPKFGIQVCTGYDFKCLSPPFIWQKIFAYISSTLFGHSQRHFKKVHTNHNLFCHGIFLRFSLGKSN